MTLLLKKQNNTLTALLQFAFFRQQRANEQDEQERHAYSRAFAELVTYIIESQRSHQGESFFKLADLNDLMTKRLTQLG